MASIIQAFEDEDEHSKHVNLKEAHFFWMTRSVDEFLFGRKHMTRISMSPSLRKRVYLHLHVTAKEPDGDAASFLFRQCVKRQSQIDRKLFHERHSPDAPLYVAPELPWCWVHNSKLDVMWLSHLTNADIDGKGEASSSGVVQDAGGDDDEESSRFAEDDAQSATRRNLTWANDHPIQWGPRRPMAATESAPSQWADVWTMSDFSRQRSVPTAVVRSGSGRSPQQSETPASAAQSDKENPLIPVAFGRPDFESELRAIGSYWRSDSVNIYICGNDAIVRGLQDTAAKLNAEERQISKRPKRKQALKYTVTYERFG
jgi:hypothetical protein